MNRISNTPWGPAFATMMLIAPWGGTLRESAANETITQVMGTNAEVLSGTIAKADGFGAGQEPAGWWVEIDVDEGNRVDTMRSAYSPPATTPEALVDDEGNFGSVIRYLCLNAAERKMGNVAPAHLVFGDRPSPTSQKGAGSGGTRSVELRAAWGEERVVLQAVQYGNRIYLAQDDAEDRGTGESSDAEFLRRLLESPSTASDSLAIELDWQEVGVVRYDYSLEGAADAIREAGRPCGVGRSGASIRRAQRS